MRESENRKRERKNGWVDGYSEKRETEAAEVVNRSCGTHLSPLLTLCDLYHTHTHAHTHVCGEKVGTHTHKPAAKN